VHNRVPLAFTELVSNRRVQQLGDALLLYVFFSQLVRLTITLDQSWNETAGSFDLGSAPPSIAPILLSGLADPAQLLIAVFVIHTNRWTSLRKAAATICALGVGIGAVAQFFVADVRPHMKIEALGLIALFVVFMGLLATAHNAHIVDDASNSTEDRSDGSNSPFSVGAQEDPPHKEDGYEHGSIEV
jgi:hypothetical protein